VVNGDLAAAAARDHVEREAIDVRERGMNSAGAAASDGNERFKRDEATVRRNFWTKLRHFAARIPFAEDLLTAYYCAFDRDTPVHVRMALIGALAYFISPFDALPDVLPLLGLTDDAAVVAGAIKLVWDNIKPSHRAAARDALSRLNEAPRS
jgi:uncharacterized membrane protein YkvA (DUF1232 family)